MIIPFLIIENRLLLNAFLSGLNGNVNICPFRAGILFRRGFHRQLESVQEASCITRGGFNQMIQGSFFKGGVVFSISSDSVFQGLPGNSFKVFIGQSFQLKEPAPTDQGGIPSSDTLTDNRVSSSLSGAGRPAPPDVAGYGKPGRLLIVYRESDRRWGSFSGRL